MPQPMKLKARNKHKKEYLTPNGINLNFGSLPPITVMIRSVRKCRGYVRPVGASKIVVIGFINQTEFDTRGFGFKQLYNVLTPYSQTFCKRQKRRLHVDTARKNSNALKLISEGLVRTNTAALCILSNTRNFKPCYGFLIVDTDDKPNRLVLGTLSKYVLGCETWIDKIKSQLRRAKKRRNIIEQSNAVPAGLWTDFTSLAKNTSLRMQLLIQRRMTPVEFDKLIDELLHHARVIGNNPIWLCGIMSHLRLYAKGKEAIQALKDGISKVEQFKP